jgi:hypothetical protein
MHFRLHLPQTSTIFPLVCRDRLRVAQMLHDSPQAAHQRA